LNTNIFRLENEKTDLESKDPGVSVETPTPEKSIMVII
jgi:hypothetical protein